MQAKGDFMKPSLTLSGQSRLRFLSFLTGVGMVWASVLTIEHYFAANFPETIWEGSICDINAFFNCDSSAFSVISQIGGVPLGYFGLIVGALVALGALFPSAPFERTNKTIALLNAAGVVVLFLFSAVYLGSLCLLCSLYYLFSLVSFAAFWKFGIDSDKRGLLAKYCRPSLKYVATFAVITLVGAYAFALYHDAKEDAQTGGVATRIVDQFFSLPQVPSPSFISPFWTAKATEQFEDAPIQVIEYVDLLCPDCLYLSEQLDRLKDEFAGKINIAFQMFPLEAECNDVVSKDLHPGACDVSLMAIHDPDSFQAIHDEIWANFRSAKRNPEWRADLASRYGVEEALDDPETQELLQRMIQTGKEYAQTDERYEHGIRSTPTMIINNRLVIGTLPYEQLRAIFQALVDRAESGEQGFLESWVGS
jgi:protein-disulfide isomerase/uncharacterized membrane protein